MRYGNTVIIGARRHGVSSLAAYLWRSKWATRYSKVYVISNEVNTLAELGGPSNVIFVSTCDMKKVFNECQVQHRMASYGAKLRLACEAAPLSLARDEQKSVDNRSFTSFDNRSDLASFDNRRGLNSFDKSETVLFVMGALSKLDKATRKHWCTILAEGRHFQVATLSILPYFRRLSDLERTQMDEYYVICSESISFRPQSIPIAKELKVPVSLLVSDEVHTAAYINVQDLTKNHQFC
jgi:hypothetical protein